MDLRACTFIVIEYACVYYIIWRHFTFYIIPILYVYLNKLFDLQVITRLPKREMKGSLQLQFDSMSCFGDGQIPKEKKNWWHFKLLNDQVPS